MPDVILPTFHVMPDSPTERWSLIRRFVENWKGLSLPSTTDVQVPPLPPNNTTSKYPVSILEWFRFWHALGLAGSSLLHGNRIVIQAVPGNDAVSLMYVEEGEPCWGVFYSDLVHDDPPVHTFRFREGSGRELFADTGMPHQSITEFALHYLALNIFPRSWSLSAPVTETQIQQMQSEFQSNARLGKVWIFESPDVAALVKTNGTLTVGMPKSPQYPPVPNIVDEVLKEHWGEDWGEDAFRATLEWSRTLGNRFKNHPE